MFYLTPRANYVLCDQHGRSMAVIEAKRFSISPGDATEQAKSYARQLASPMFFWPGEVIPGLPFLFRGKVFGKCSKIFHLLETKQEVF